LTSSKISSRSRQNRKIYQDSLTVEP